MACRPLYALLVLLLFCVCDCVWCAALPDATPASASLYHRDCSACNNTHPVSGCWCFSDDDGLNTSAGERRYFSAPMSFETVNDMDRILVGAMDAAFVLNYNLNETKRINWPTSGTQRGQCVSVFSSDPTAETFRCRNHIRHFGVLKGRNPETLALCGTYSIFRACSYIEASELVATSPNITVNESRFSIAEVGSVPSEPDTSYVELPRASSDTDPVIINGVTIVTNTDNYGVIGYNQLFVDQSKGMIDTNMRTDPTKVTHVSRPQRFVEVFDHNYQMGSEGAADLDFVFVAFQEPDPGNTNNWISRIARVCRNDISSSVLSGPGRLGGTADTSSDRQQFFPMTFVKARVSCQIPAQTNADLPHSFDRIRGFQLVSNSTFQPGTERSEVGYGLFADGDEAPSGSAVCAYEAQRGTGDNNNGLFDIFRRRYINLDNGQQIDNPSGFNCSDGGQSRITGDAYALQTVIEPPMLQIGTPDAPPLFILDGVQLTRIQVDPRRPVIRGSPGAVERQDVVFASSDEGTIYKVFLPADAHPVVSEKIMLDGTEVFNLHLKTDPTSNKKYLFSSTVNGVWRVDLSNCERFTTCQDCVAVQDPYCAWQGGMGGSCVELPMDIPDPTVYLQGVDTGVNSDCPPLVTSSSVAPTTSSVAPTTPTSSVAPTTPTSSVAPTTSTVTETVTETVSVSFTETVTDTSTETVSISVTAAMTTITNIITITETVASITIEVPGPTPSCEVISVGPSINTGGLGTAPSPTDAITAVGAVGGLFVVAAVILGVVLGGVVVFYVRDRRGNYRGETVVSRLPPNIYDQANNSREKPMGNTFNETHVNEEALEKEGDPYTNI